VTQTIILGIGQEQRGDDEIGLLAVRQWQADYGRLHPDVTAELLTSPGLSLIDRLRGFQRGILVDAVVGGQPAGQLLTLDEEALLAFDLGARSAHGWGVAESLRIARAVLPGELPGDLRLLAVTIDPPQVGAPRSEAVKAAVQPAVELLEELLTTPLSAAVQPTSQAGIPKTSPN